MDVSLGLLRWTRVTDRRMWENSVEGRGKPRDTNGIDLSGKLRETQERGRGSTLLRQTFAATVITDL